ncbi:hypothetical protein KHF85_03110 [Xanthomonas translucens pv. graminis]|uniref:hypothetical protein n=1 Tax=Xanthomonas graminis TaxID=3390026 RepID=UPI002541D017|nr:hypothetical protein [Xanthomonas translucens]WIH05506.1 hypothetical protein KHF85_03110 [Xanthomonas translucens pv. graminis]
MADPLYCPLLVSVPCLKAEVWAAWAQAGLSAIAIYAAGRFAVAQHRRDIATRVQSICEIIAFAAYVAEQFESISTDVLATDGAKHWNLSELRSVGSRLAQIPLHELPDADLIGPLLQAIEGMDALDLYVTRAVSEAANRQRMTIELMKTIQTKAGVVVFAGKRAELIDARHKPRPAFRKIAGWLGRRRS